MNSKVRRKFEMGVRALTFADEHPDASPGYSQAVARLRVLIQRARELAEQQQQGLRDSRAGSNRKFELRQGMKADPLKHLPSVAELAAVEDPQLPEIFAVPKGTTSYLAFRTVARSIEAEALSRKEMLMKYGLSDTVLQKYSTDLNEFDVVTEQAAKGRATHVGASFELDVVTTEMVQVVKVMNGHNRARFRNQGELLRAWESASNVVATPQTADDEPAPEGTPQAKAETGPSA
jgi:hypothetical protein